MSDVYRMDPKWCSDSQPVWNTTLYNFGLPLHKYSKEEIGSDLKVQMWRRVDEKTNLEL